MSSSGGSGTGQGGQMSSGGDGDTCAPSGGAYYQFDASIDDCGNHNKPPADVLSIDFEAPTSGFYLMVWRNLRDHREGDCTDDRNNDSYASFPDALNGAHFRSPFKVFGGGQGTFTWSAQYDISGVGKDDVCIELASGVSEMFVSGRSNHHAIDRAALIFTGETLEGCRSFKKGDLDQRTDTGQM